MERITKKTNKKLRGAQLNYVPTRDNWRQIKRKLRKFRSFTQMRAQIRAIGDIKTITAIWTSGQSRQVGHLGQSKQ